MGYVQRKNALPPRHNNTESTHNLNERHPRCMSVEMGEDMMTSTAVCTDVIYLTYS